MAAEFDCMTSCNYELHMNIISPQACSLELDKQWVGLMIFIHNNMWLAHGTRSFSQNVAAMESLASESNQLQTD